MTTSRRPTFRRVQLAAAAVVLVALSSSVTALVMRERSASPGAAAAPIAAAPVEAAAPASLAAFSATEAEYRRVSDELWAAVNAQRGALAPQTLVVVERNLAVIDAAIREAREALLRDPANRPLLELLTARYEQRVDLLRRTSQLAAGS